MATDQKNRSEIPNDPATRDHTDKVIAFAYVKSWEKLPPHTASMLAHVSPVLFNRASDEAPGPRGRIARQSAGGSGYDPA